MAGTAAKTEVTQRLQDLVVGWGGAERGQPTGDLHEECTRVAGSHASHLLPARLLLVADLDVSTLDRVLRMRGTGGDLSFRVQPVGRFDAALVPVGPVNEVPNRWLLVLNAGLPLHEQQALYGHALGHLLLSHSYRQMGSAPELDAADGKTHVDLLARLQRQEQTRTPVDQHVLDSYPRLAQLLLPAQESTTGATEEPALWQQLADAGWRGPLVQQSYPFTDGRILGAGGRRGQRERVDALLRAEASLPLAVVRVLRPGDSRLEVEAALQRLAVDRFSVPFAYLLDGRTITEYDWTASGQGQNVLLRAFPERAVLLARWLESLGLSDAKAKEALCHPYHLGGNKPRYYQEVAINRSVIAVLQAQRGLRPRRILLTQATGTGKTKVAFQITWKLRQARVIGNVLFLTDRDTLLGQAMDNDFVPFGDARARVRGTFVTSRSIFFATYQALAGDALHSPMFRRYARDYFSLIIVDECHRGSAQDDSNWRAVLEWFDQAIQIGLTATPLRTDNVQTYAYFDQPVATYSLRQGILDGFLAPYKVRRVLMTTESGTEQPSTAPRDEEQGRGPLPSSDGTPAAMLVEEARSALVERTEAIAAHIAAYVRETDPLAKTIVFCVDQAHAERMLHALRRTCAELVTRYPDYIERIVADTGQDGKRALGRFQQPAKATPVIVTTSKLLSTGVDVPTCKNIVLARPVESIVEFKQIIGRGTRLHLPEKTSFTIVDYAGATKYFFDPEFDGTPEAVTIDTLTPRPPTQEASQPTSPSETVRPQLPVAAVPTETGTHGQPEQIALTPVDATPDVNTVAASPTRETPQASRSALLSVGEPDPEQAAVWASSRDGTADASRAQVQGGGDPASPSVGATTSPAPGLDSAGPPQPTSHPPSTAHAGLSQPGGGRGDSGERVRPADGRRVRVVGEIVMELAPDGTTLRSISYHDYTREALAGLCTSPSELRTRWLRPEQRAEIRDRLEEQGVNLSELAAVLRLPDADPFDLLLHVAFGQQALTRRQRSDRLQRDHADFLAGHQGLAREVLETVLAKYVAGEAPDVSDVQLLQVPPLSKRGTPMELAQPFLTSGGVRRALKELENLLYTG